MQQPRIQRILKLGVILVFAGAFFPGAGWAQAPKGGAAAAPTPSMAALTQPDAQATRQELSNLLERYPPALRGALRLDPSLLGNEPYLAPYPVLAGFVNAHPEIARNPSFYLGESSGRSALQDHRTQIVEMWNDALKGLAVFAAFGMAIGLVVWLVRTLVDYRRWSRLAKVQTDAHTKLLDRFTSNEDLLVYIQSPAGSKFLESSPIKLDAGPRSVGAPLGRILWSLQGGVVLVAAGIGAWLVSRRLTEEAGQPLQVLGVLGIAVGVGFVISAIISFVISQRLGLIERQASTRRIEAAGVEESGNLR
jgi:hypothetical protein